MVLLTATALTYRAFTRSDQAMTQREQQVIVNSATPAIDRAKAKIEFMFQSDPRFPSGVPASDILADLMANERDSSPDGEGNRFVGYTTQVPLLKEDDDGNDADPYTLPDETRVNINGGFNGANADELDNAWMFKADIDGDGVVGDDEIIVYSILVDDLGPEDVNPNDQNETRTPVALQDTNTQDKANVLVTRTGPIATTQVTAACGGAIAEGGWQIVQAGNNSTLQKNFQVNVFVANSNDANRTYESMEFQQSRIAARASKWGAWFRYDLEIHPGADFNWNGAMHTDGNLVLWGQLDAFMVSDPDSCVYSRRASEITLGEFDNDGDDDINVYQDDPDDNFVADFQGQVMGAKTDGDSWGTGNMEMHIFDGLGALPITNETIDERNDSVDELNSVPSDVAMNPLVLFAQDRATHIATGTEDNPLWRRDEDWEDTSDGGNPFRQVDRERIYNEITAQPYVDDFFRADNRLGPKPRYDNSGALDMTVDNDGANTLVSGIEISESSLDSTRQGQLTNSITGLDGYWERQAIHRGLRLIVGERLELGNPNGWGFDPRDGSTDPGQEALYPHTDVAFDNTGINGRYGGAHERLHRKALRDNLAAVQSMAVYHYQGGGMASDGTFPLACYALTAHPGTEQTIINSRTFGTWDNGKVRTDFLTGKGTNGWEFRYNNDSTNGFDTPAKFANQIDQGEPLGIALRNLAYFAGDPDGGAPSFPPEQGIRGEADDFPHPYPFLSMWGDFSMLRRVLDKVDTAVGGGDSYTEAYEALSFADKSTLHTAACTVSMLAYNIKEQSDEYDAAIQEAIALIGDGNLNSFAVHVSQLLDGVDSPGNPEIFSVLGTDSYSDWATTRDVVDNSSGSPDARPGCTTDTLNTYEIECDAADYLAQYTSDDWLEAWRIWKGATQAEVDALRAYVQIIQFGNAITRDRALGFKEGNSPNFLSSTNNVPWDPSTGYLTATKQISNDELIIKYTCDPDIFSPYTGGGGNASNGVRQSWVASLQSLINSSGTMNQGWGNSNLAMISSPSWLIAQQPPGNGNGNNGEGTDNGNNGGGNNGGGGSSDRDLLALGLMFCSPGSEPIVRYPSLYYLFPLFSHGYDGNNDVALGIDHTQPLTEEYIDEDNDASTEEYVRTVSTSDYEVVKSSGGNDYDGFADIAALPGANDSTLSDWVLPHTTPAAGTLSNPDANDEAFRIAIDSNVANVAFLDKGVFNGREMLNSRVLDIDISALTNDGPIDEDYWLTADLEADAKGIVYAFREDAVREDEIVRPRNADTTNITPAHCMEVNRTNGFVFRLEREAECQMNADPANAQDPPLTVDGISLKPVDFFPDPERRTHGFRLRTSQINNDGDFEAIDFSGGDPAADDARIVGMTFVTDNSVYIMGNFNPHSADPTGILNGNNLNTANILEEFQEGVLGTNYDNTFYNRTNLNTGRFANLTVDHWRPVEILSDAITVLSRNFVDGSVEDSFTRNTPSSYTNQTGPQNGTDRDDWVHSTQGDNDSPVWIDRNGVFYFIDSDVPTVYYDATPLNQGGEWRDISEGKQLQASDEDTYINATFVSGITPKRANQGYGGLHNFPRFNQNWNSELFIQGSFIQLNFSTASTGPYEQEGLEPGDLPIQGDEVIAYYDPPDRRWGYDVGLLYVPPAPAAERFVDIESPRSEYYRQVASDDPYIVNLRCAIDADGNYVFTEENIRGACPG